ncbi:acyl-CoA dehydrogenase family protein [Rhodobacteraceae bacterium N5(2021)]|uniref:Acyl-CoA dehydrogenase family protein n=1 Tax=Gymnodinialimonas phycosphaerae TaxID=2841589 RepID=A0A975TVW8_9RHOB|nr:acyl-CoA dehydrogenase family protein [Gymnodinialimonas phycosphaerae]MBY4891362.1 acyl-CoA dehydrogenase family protein [Gymnodinialimonas phycosphaerae]
MNFEQSDDRRMLSETLRRYLADAYGIEHRNAVAYADPFHDPERWAELTDLGLFYALVPEARGGMGGHGFDIVTVFEELGRALCPEPVLGQLLAAALLADTDALMTGTRYALAISETDAPYGIHDITTTAVQDRLTGRKTVVYGAPTADVLLVAARDGDSIGLFQVTASEAEITGYAMIDGGPAGEVFFDETPAQQVMENAEDLLQTALDRGALALCAEALGAMDVVQGMLVDYLKTRKQFGQPLGAFQALQHRAIDLAIEIEQARSIVILAASADGTEAFAKRAAQAKHLVGRIARQVSEEAIQMHGGIGITWEYPLSHYAKRLVMIDHQLGDSDWHLERLMADLAGGA